MAKDNDLPKRETQPPPKDTQDWNDRDQNGRRTGQEGNK